MKIKYSKADETRILAAINKAKGNGCTIREVASYLNARGIKTASDKTWSANNVNNFIGSRIRKPAAISASDKPTEGYSLLKAIVESDDVPAAKKIKLIEALLN